tara:strand:- start:160 stop:441 length:282 start_codon:yes stop_codon:yes gene_type:complete
MVKANDLIKDQEERDKQKKDIYKKVYKNVETKILQSSTINQYQCWYRIPEFMINLPLYNTEDCKKYIEKKLKKNGFNYYSDNNIIIISWNKFK